MSGLISDMAYLVRAYIHVHLDKPIITEPPVYVFIQLTFKWAVLVY